MMQASKYFSFVLSISDVSSGFSKRLFGKEDFEAILFLPLRFTIYAFCHLEGLKQLDATTNRLCVKKKSSGSVLLYFLYICFLVLN